MCLCLLSLLCHFLLCLHLRRLSPTRISKFQEKRIQFFFCSIVDLSREECIFFQCYDCILSHEWILLWMYNFWWWDVRMEKKESIIVFEGYLPLHKSILFWLLDPRCKRLMMLLRLYLFPLYLRDRSILTWGFS